MLNKSTKSIITVSAISLACTLTIPAFAMPSGSYLGISGIYSKFGNNTLDNGAVIVSKNKDSDYGGGVFAGYQMPNDIGIMFAANYAGRNTYKIDNTANSKYSFYDADVLVTAAMPIGKVFDVYAAAGAAYVYANINGVKPSVDKNPAWWRPKVAVGADINLLGHYALGVSYSRIFGKGELSDLYNGTSAPVNGKDYLPSIDTISVNFSYKFSLI